MSFVSTAPLNAKMGRINLPIIVCDNSIVRTTSSPDSNIQQLEALDGRVAGRHYVQHTGPIDSCVARNIFSTTSKSMLSGLE